MTYLIFCLELAERSGECLRSGGLLASDIPVVNCKQDV